MKADVGDAEYQAAIRRAVADCPPLTPRQLIILRSIFSSTASGEIIGFSPAKDSESLLASNLDLY